MDVDRDEQWAMPSLCDGWTVHDVVAHLIDTARTTRLGFILGLARARFDFDRQNAVGVDKHRGSTPAETLDRLRAVATRTSASFGGARELVAAVRLAATDADVTIGEGSKVTGPLLSLLLAVSGRTAALEDLSGPGVATLASALGRRA